MSEARTQSWTWDAYLTWEAHQTLRHELIEGQVHAMGGGTAEHDLIANNLRGELRSRLRGHRCRPHGPDLKVKAGINARYPDALYAQEPVAVFEILSKSTAWIDQTLKLRDYDPTDTVRYYVLVSQDEMRALVYTRDAAGRLGHRTPFCCRERRRPSNCRSLASRCRSLRSTKALPWRLAKFYGAPPSIVRIVPDV